MRVIPSAAALGLLAFVAFFVLPFVGALVDGGLS